MKDMNLNKIKSEVLKYLSENVQNTPKEFKKLIDHIVTFYKDCDVNLGILVNYDFDFWGECWGLNIRISECKNILAHVAEGECLVLSIDRIDYLLDKDIYNLVFEFLMENYEEIIDDDVYEKLYNDLEDELEINDEFKMYKGNYFYMLVARYLKTNIESMLEHSEFADKTDKYYALTLKHNNKKIITYGVKYTIH